MKTMISLVTGLSTLGLLTGAGSNAAPVQEPDEETRFANPGLLVDTEWLDQHRGDEGVRVVDARKPDRYAAGHVPGAVHVPPSATFDPKGPSGAVGPAERVAALFGSKGIDRDVHVVVYDEGVSTAAARIFWTLEYLGHPNVSVLDGGAKKWRAEERELSEEVPAVTATEFTLELTPARLSTKDGILTALDGEEVVMLDARTQREWDGGRIPGAVHVEWTRSFTTADVPVFRSPKELSELFEKAGVARDKTVHAY